MRKNNILVLTALLLTMAGISSCVTTYSYVFTIKNHTTEELTVTTNTIVPDYRVQVHNYYESGTYNRYYNNMSDTIFIVPPQSDISVKTDWESRSIKQMISPQGLSETPEFDGVTPAWKFIRDIKIGSHSLSPSIWDSSSKWSIIETDDYSREYILEIMGV